MRYYWGLAVGHVYTHGRKCTHEGVLCPASHRHQEPDAHREMEETRTGPIHTPDALTASGDASPATQVGRDNMAAAEPLRPGGNVHDLGSGLEPENKESDTEDEGNSSSDSEGGGSSVAKGSTEELEIAEMEEMYGDIDPEWEDDD